MKNDKQDRKLLAQLAAGYMASRGHPALALAAVEYEIKDSVKYAIGALAAIDTHLEAWRATEVQAVLDSVPAWAEWRMMEDGAEHLIDTRSGKLLGRIESTCWLAVNYPGCIDNASGFDRDDLAKAKIIKAVQWAKWEAHGAKVLADRTPAQAERASTSTEPSAIEILLRPVDWRDLVDEPAPAEPETAQNIAALKRVWSFLEDEILRQTDVLSKDRLAQASRTVLRLAWVLGERDLAERAETEYSRPTGITPEEWREHVANKPETD
jgi:hypothetical protein